MKTAILALLLALPLAAQPASRAYQLSAAAVGACAAADSISSWGRYEANPVLSAPGGRFGGRSLAIKSAITGGTVGALWLVQRRWPHLRTGATWGNWIGAGATCGVAARNWAIR